MRNWILIAGALLGASSATAKEAGQPRPLFASDAPIHATIQGPMSTLAVNRTGVPRPATLIVDGVIYPITLTARGLTRKSTGTCDFPPLRVVFTRPAPSGSLFEHQHHLKLVTHCKRSPDFQQKVLLEYSGYLLYNRMTPQSFRARLANIDYRDESGRPYVSRVGYFLEEFSDVAKRNGMTAAHLPDTIPGSMLEPVSSARFAVFEYMISNYDWSMRAGPKGVPCCHNSRLLQSGSGNQVIPVPYDFDWSGLVDAPYAGPPEGIPIESVRERTFRGYCAHLSQARAVTAELAPRRAEFLQIFATVPGLDLRNQKRAISYVNDFFNDLDSGKIFRNCVK
ncbi:MAG TPA: hypothetical protein VGU01_11785 [Sphingomicrobium sp.]|nr:hypothetical protein [Sphingomicrobium sp.]